MDRNFRKELNKFGMIFLDEEKEWVMDLLDDFDKVRKERDELVKSLHYSHVRYDLLSERKKKEEER